MKEKTKNILANIGLFLFGLMVVLALSEIALRLTMPRFLEQSLNYYEPDADIGFKYKPNIAVMIAPAQGEKSYRLETNSLGYREKEILQKQENVFRIMGLGDSFTFGVDVEKEETFLNFLEQKMNSENQASGKKIETLNFGVSSYGTLHEVAVLKKFGAQINPDLVLLNFYNGNDFYDNANKEISSISENNEGEACGSVFSCARNFLTKNSYLFAFIDFQIGKIPALKKIFFDLGLAKHFLPPELMMLKENGMPEEKIAIEKTKQYLAEFKQESEKISAKPVLVIIPVATQVDGELLKNFANAYGLKPEEIDADRPNRILKGIAEEIDLETIDLTPEIKEKNKTEKLFFPGAGHFTAEGNKEAAEIIAQKIAKEIT